MHDKASLLFLEISTKCLFSRTLIIVSTSLYGPTSNSLQLEDSKTILNLSGDVFNIGLDSYT